MTDNSLFDPLSFRRCSADCIDDERLSAFCLEAGLTLSPSGRIERTEPITVDREALSNELRFMVIPCP